MCDYTLQHRQKKKEVAIKKFVVEKARGLGVSNSEVSYWWSGRGFGFGAVSHIFVLMDWITVQCTRGSRL